MDREDEILAVLKEILKWNRFTGLENARLELRRVLDTEQKRVIYHLSDGGSTSTEIAKKSGVSDFTVRKYWSDWNKRGIVDPLSVRGGKRFKKSFELEDLGLMIPQINTVEKEG